MSCFVVRVKCVLVVVFGSAITEVPLPRGSSFGVIDKLNEIVGDEGFCVNNILSLSAVGAVSELVY